MFADTGNAWGDWDPKEFTVEDSAFGFITMENGATIVLESSWALNTLVAQGAIDQGDVPAELLPYVLKKGPRVVYTWDSTSCQNLKRHYTIVTLGRDRCGT